MLILKAILTRAGGSFFTVRQVNGSSLPSTRDAKLESRRVY